MPAHRRASCARASTGRGTCTRRRRPTGPGDVVLILGPGQRGLASVIAARAAGADTIIVTGLSRDAAKLALARELGADHTIDIEQEDARARVREFTGGRGADVVVEVSAYAPEPVA